MKITVVISVLLISQHFGNVRGDFPFFRPDNHLGTQTQQPLDPQLLQLTQSLQQLDQSLQHPHIPLKQPNPALQQPFPPFQQKDLLQQQPRHPFQQPFQQLQQQLYHPFQQPYTQQLQSYPPQLQPYPPLQQPTQDFNQQLICPQGTPTCADGRPAICTRHAVTGLPVYSCLKPIPQKEFPWASDVPGMAPPSSTNSMFSGPNPLNSTGGRSLLEMLPGSNSDTASLLRSDTNPTGHGLRTNSEVGNQGLNPSMPNGLDYPCSNLLCSTCSFLIGSFAPFQTCKLGQIGYPHLSKFPLPPLSQPGNVQPVTSTANVAQPGYLAAHPYPPAYPQPGSPPRPNYSPDFQSPPYPGQGLYQSPGPIPPNPQTLLSHTLNNEPKPQDTGLLSMLPEFVKKIFSRSHPLSDDQQQMAPPNNPYNPMNQPIHTVPFSGGLNYPMYQRMPPFQPAWNPSIFRNPESRLPERPPLLRLLESPGIELPVTGYTAIPGLPQQNIPTFRGLQSLTVHHNPLQNPLQNPLLSSALANLVYQAPRMSASMAQRVQSPTQPGYQGLDQFSLPLGPKTSQHHPWDLQRTPDINQPNPNSQYLPTAQNYTFDKMPQKRKSSLQADNPQNPQSLRAYLSSGLSLLSLPDEGPSRGSIEKYDKRSSMTQHVKKIRTRKPSTSSYWF